jgi:hypothetical protein
LRKAPTLQAAPETSRMANGNLGSVRGERLVQRGAGVPVFAERPKERLLLAAIAALLVAALAAALWIPDNSDRRAIAREAGSLLAPPSDALFTDAFGRPLTPSSSLPGSDSPARAPSGPDPAPGTPGTPGTPAPPVPAPEEPADDDGILGFLPDLPILPPLPPLPGPAKGSRGSGKAKVWV